MTANTLSFMERLRAGEILVADGATGTNLQARGLERGQPSETWLFERPEEIVRLHQDFLEAGADILLTCTFGASPLRMGASAAGHSAAEANQRAVELARQAIQRSEAKLEGEPKPRHYLAGSLGPSGQLLKPYGPLDEEQVFASYREQAQALAEAGVDLLVIETQFDLNEGSQALKAALQIKGSLPIVVSFSYDRGTRSMMGVRPAQMAEHFAQLVSAEQDAAERVLLGVNCGRSLEENLQALKELRLATSKLPNSVRLWFKPNAGLPKAGAQGEAIYEVTPEAMGALAPAWIAAGAQIVGGCCGTSPAHLAAIASAARAAAAERAEGQ